jgi:poly-gamma-glutamate biosynthesis protein PgsC/CapC
MYDEIIVIGVVISLIYFELTGWSPGGIIVPGYFALNLKVPLRVFSTIVVVLITWLLIRLLSRYIILFGQRKFAFCIVLAFVLHQAVIWIAPMNPGIIGYLVPGILANQIDNQGVAVTSLSLVIVTAVLTLILLAAGIPVFR